jgi:hypothetical protein
MHVQITAVFDAFMAADGGKHALVMFLTPIRAV